MGGQGAGRAGGVRGGGGSGSMRRAGSCWCGKAMPRAGGCRAAGLSGAKRPAPRCCGNWREEVGLSGGGAELFGLYSRRAGWATNVIALYTIRGGTTAFRPNWEIRGDAVCEPLDAPPDGATEGTLRRLAELRGADAARRILVRLAFALRRLYGQSL